MWRERSAIGLLWMMAAASLSAQVLLGGAEEQVSFTMQIVPSKALPGDTVEVRVAAAVAPGWHIYSMTPPPKPGPLPTSIRVEAADLTPLGPFVQPTPLRKKDNAFDMVVESFEGEATFVGKFRVADNASPGEKTIAVSVRFMVCNDRSCLPPTTTTLTAALTVSAAARTAAPAAAHAPQPSPPEPVPQPPAPTVTAPEKPASATPDAYVAVTRARGNGLLAYLGFAVSMGFLALLTPCVFPMVPITVSFFTKKEGLSRVQGLAQALVYCGGIIATFTGLGILLALLFGAAAVQSVASNVWVNALIATVFVVFALSLFGAFEIRVPHRVLNFLGARPGGTGTVATLLMGLTFTLTSFTCTVPFVGTVLVGATQGELVWAVTGMLGFSAAFASPFFLLAVFPQWLASLPRAGGWLNGVKVTMGFLELAAALKFLSNIDLVLDWRVLPREFFLAAWVALALVAAVYLLGKIQLPLDTAGVRVGPVRLLWGLAFLTVAFYLGSGLFGRPLGELDAFLPPYSVSGEASLAGGASTAEKDRWLQTYDGALAEARRVNRPIFIDFTGVTCTNCRWMEKNIFARNDISALLDDFVLVQLWTDRADDESAANQKMQKQRFGTVALPFYAIVSSDDRVLATFDGLTRDPSEFRSFLTAGLDRFNALVAAR
jgi:thiol:disulfide interchange protein DsbD